MNEAIRVFKEDSKPNCLISNLQVFSQPNLGFWEGLRKRQAAGPSGFTCGREVGFAEGKAGCWVNHALGRLEMLWEGGSIVIRLSV